MTPPPTAASPTEKGTALEPGATNRPMPGSSSAKLELNDLTEHVPELVWPSGLPVYDRMVRTDGQMSALMDAIRLPVLRRRYELDPAGADPVDVRRIAEDLGVPILGSDEPEPTRGRARFNHREHLEHALLALRYGSYWFEVVGEEVEDEDGRAWRLRKLAPRPTRTLRAVLVKDSGGLEGILQEHRDPAKPPVFIPVDELVGFVWKREGANWYGTSMLRAAYRSWYLKGQLVVADTAGKRRNALGIPTFTPGANAGPDTINAYRDIGRRLSAGQDVSITHAESDAKFELVGVTGSTANALESVRYHDEDAAKAFLAMWMQLANSAKGSHALGDTLLDVFNAGIDTIADDWYCAGMNEYVIRDWMRYNHTENHTRPIPRLVSRRLESPELAVVDLISAVEQGLVVLDEPTRAWFRSSYNLPKADAASADQPGLAAPGQAPTLTAVPDVAAGREEHVHAAALDDGPSSRQRWRELTEREVHAAIDPEAMDQRWRDAVARLAAAWPALRNVQIVALEQQILDADGDVNALANLVAPVVGATTILAEMSTIAEAAAADAIAEAAAQGVAISGPGLDSVRSVFVQRAEAAAGSIAKQTALNASALARGLTGGSMTPAQVAAEVRLKLVKTSDTWIAERVQGELTAAQNEARSAVIDAGPAPVSLVATEIMDANTCGPCAAVDGREYGSLEEAKRDYPVGGFHMCDGFDRCRGFVFAEYEAGTDLNDVRDDG